MCHCIVWYCPSCWGGYCIESCVTALSGIVLHVGGGIVLNRVSLHCLVLSFMLGGIVLNRVSLHCLVLQLPDGSDRPTYFDIVLHCLVLYCIVWYCIALSGIVLHCLVLYCIVWHCIRLSGIVLHCLALYYIV